MDRPVQVSDQAEIILPDGTQVHSIELIEGTNIYISVGQGESSLLIPDEEGQYHVQGLEVPHDIRFIAIEPKMVQAVLIGEYFLDLYILSHLDDGSLEQACQIDDYFNQLCAMDELWIDKIVFKFGQDKIDVKPAQISPREFYYLLSRYPLSVGGANLAVTRNDRWSLEQLIIMGYGPDIGQGQLREVQVVQGGGMLNRPPLEGIRREGAVEEIQREDAEQYFLRYNLVNEDTLDFFRLAELGPQIAGNFMFNPTTQERLADLDSIEPLDETRLNDLLYFTQGQINGRENPLYGITRESHLHPLFILHAYHTQMAHPDNPRRLSASLDMRQYLGNIMRTTIDHDVSRVQQYDPSQSQRAQEIGEQLKQAIDDPTLQIDSRFDIPAIGRILEIFNPNNFPPSYFTKLYGAMAIDRITADELDQLQPEIALVYITIPGIQLENAFEKVILVYQDIVALAKAYQGSLRGQQ